MFASQLCPNPPTIHLFYIPDAVLSQHAASTASEAQHIEGIESRIMEFYSSLQGWAKNLDSRIRPSQLLWPRSPCLAISVSCQPTTALLLHLVLLLSSLQFTFVRAGMAWRQRTWDAKDWEYLVGSENVVNTSTYIFNSLD